MYFLDFFGPAHLFQELREPLARELAATFRAPVDSAHVRRVVTEGDTPQIELWVELSSEEQLVRLGRDLAERLSAVVRRTSELDVWVMFRIVPLSRAFLNGEPRGRARAWPG
jgi:hypothetical protein